MDSPASRDGGRSLWAVPKELAGFTWGRVGTGAVPATDCVVRDDRGPIASAAFGVPRLVPPRLPFSGTTWQPRDDGSSVLASLSGSARSFPVRARWSFAPDGPLGWLAGRTPFASFVLHDFRMTFG